MTGFRPSLRRLRVVLDRRARADEVTIAVDIVDAPHRTPVLVSARGTCGKAALGAGIGPRPSVVGDVVHRMWRVTQRRSFDLPAPGLDFGDFAPDRDHGIAEPVELGLRFGFGRLD